MLENQNESHILIVGDSLSNNIDESRLTRKNTRVKMRAFPRATADDLHHYVKPLSSRKPSQVILHAGTNDLRSKKTEEIIDNLFRVKDVIHMNHPENKVIFSSLITRTDSEALTEKLTHFNKHFFDICKSNKYDIIDTSNIHSSCLSFKGLHLNRTGFLKLGLGGLNIHKVAI